MTDIASVTSALAPAFAAGFALQRLIEIADSVVPQSSWYAQWKRTFLAIISFGVGLAVACSTNGAFLVLTQLFKAASLSPKLPGWLDPGVTALIISAGTDGFNSIVKFLEYKKADTKDASTVTDNPAATPLAFQKAAALINATSLPSPQV